MVEGVRLMIHRRVIVLAAVAALAAFLALPSSPALGATYVVDTTSDASLTTCSGSSSDCSLRGAISNANTASSPGDLITFDAGVFSPGTIAIGSQLPTLSDGGDTIDGSGATVIIQGDEERLFDCLRINSADNTVQGLQMTDCSGAILLTGGSNNTIGPDNVMFDNDEGVRLAIAATGVKIIGNKIGTNTAGTDIPAEGGNGVGVSILNRPDNIVGGTSPGDRNVISGNGSGVSMSGAGATGNTVIGNYIGTDVNGTVDRGNGHGVFLTTSASNNTIGGTAPGEANLISGNSITNVNLLNSASANTVTGNIVGPDVNGSGALSSGIGVLIQLSAINNTIGPRNVISDNLRGVQISHTGTTGNVVRGNLIGTNLTGSAGVPNASQGVWIITSASGNTIGGTGPGEGNVIAFNGDRGVEVNGVDLPSAVNNSIRGNSIHSNTGLEIDNVLGGNTELPPPIIASTLFGTVSGFACANCEVDIFSDPSTDARFYEGSVTAAGDGSFTFQNGAPFIGADVTATNTDASGNTSELTAMLIIDSDGDSTVDGSDTDDDNDGLPDASDPCRVFPEDFDGFQDADGCPDPDNDLDGICDPGQVSVSCTGSDEGKMVFDPAGTLPAPTIDCRNIPEDFDAFKDSDGCPEPDNDNDGFPDVTDACPGTDALAGADGMLGSPEDLDHNGIQNGGESALTTDDSVLVFEDYDGVIDTDGCHDSPGDDFDGDSLGLGDPFWFRDEIEVFIGTNPLDACADTSAPDDEAVDKLPADLNDDQAINILDRARMVFQLLSLTYDQRFDLSGDGLLNIQDRAIEVLYVLNFQPMGGVCTSL